MVPLYLSDVRAASEAYERRDRDTAEAYVDRASGLRYANRSLYGACAVTAVAGITHAHLTFQPEDRSSRPREIPTRTEPRAKPQASLLPFVAPAPRGDGPGFGGGMVGVSGRF